jgi:YD repeat-containing protein
VYDQVKNRTKLVDPNGGAHSFTFDALNRQSVYQKPTGHFFTSMYDPNSRLTTLMDGLGGSVIRTYDVLRRTITLIQYSPTNSPVATVIDTYDAAGRKISQNRDALLTTYVNDAANRLTGQQATGRWATFVYDPTGNVLVKAQQGLLAMTSTYDAASRIITMTQGAAKTAYTYNGAGNLVLEVQGAAQTGYVYDGENRLLKLTNPDGTIITNTYSGDGLRRTTQQPGKAVSTIVWDGQDYLGQS